MARLLCGMEQCRHLPAGGNTLCPTVRPWLVLLLHTRRHLGPLQRHHDVPHRCPAQRTHPPRPLHLIIPQISRAYLAEQVDVEHVRHLGQVFRIEASWRVLRFERMGDGGVPLGEEGFNALYG